MRTETLWLNSPWNNAEEVRQQLNFAKKIQLHDVTLRDGEQQAGLVFSHDDTAPAESSSFVMETAAAPAPLMTIRTSSSRLPTTFRALVSPARVMTAVPC